MKTFNSQRNKLINLEKSINQIQNDINKQQIKNNNIIFKFDKEITTYNYHKIFTDLSFDWENIQTFAPLSYIEAYELEPDAAVWYFKSFNIEFEKMDIRLIPFFNIDILFHKDNGQTLDNPYRYIYTSKYIQIEEINPLSEYIKKIKLQINFIILNIYPYPFENFQIKLNCFFINPKDYN